MNGVIAGGLILGRGIAQHELGAQLLGDLGVVVVHGLFLLGLEESSPGLLGDFLQDLLAVRMVLLLPGVPASPGIASARVTAARVAPSHAPVPPHAGVVSVVVVLVSSYIDGVDDGLGLLRRFNGAVQGFLAASILSIGQDHDGLPALLLLGNLIAGEKYGVIEQRAGSPLCPGLPGTLVAARGVFHRRLGVD